MTPVCQTLQSKYLWHAQVRQSLLDARDFTAVLDSLAALLVLRDALLAGDLAPPEQAPPCSASGKQGGPGRAASNTMSSSRTCQPSTGRALCSMQSPFTKVQAHSLLGVYALLTLYNAAHAQQLVKGLICLCRQRAVPGRRGLL